MTGPLIERDLAVTLLQPLTALVARAGAAVLAVCRHPMQVVGKADGSPVTQADHIADAILAEGLAELLPGVFVLSEEHISHTMPGHPRTFVLIDPLDGTREFIDGRDEYTVNLALVTDNTPLLGIVGAPALGLIWRGVVGHGAERLTVDADGALGSASAIHTRPHPPGPWVAAVSRSHGDQRTEAFIDSRPGAARRQMGSAVKFGRVAEGAADIYPRLAPTSEWDVAAGHAVVTAAGGLVTDSRGRPVRFGDAPGDVIIPEFIAWGDPAGAIANPGS